jgi:hypothetical protein
MDKKQQVISALMRKIENCRSEAKYYYEKAESDPESSESATWKVLQGYMEGRASAFQWALDTITEEL